MQLPARTAFRGEPFPPDTTVFNSALKNHSHRSQCGSIPIKPSQRVAKIAACETELGGR
jgi:hypothetical protein